MKSQDEATLEVSFAKALLLALFMMGSFVLVLFFVNFPLHDPLLVGFLIFIVTGMAFVFAAGICFMFRCKIGYDGMRSAVPTFYQKVLPWEEITGLQGFGSPFYYVRGRAFDGFCILPRKFFLKRPDSLKEIIQKYAPADNIVLKKNRINDTTRQL